MSRSITVSVTGVAVTAGVVVAVLVAVLAAYTLGTAGRGNASTPASAGAQATSAQERTIVMSGEGTALGVPNELEFSLAVDVTRADVSTAMSQASSTSRTVLRALKPLGVAGKDVQTTGISVEPEYDYSGSTPHLVGYRAVQRQRVTVRHLAAGGKVMTAAAQAGGDAVRISSISLDIAHRTALLAQARRAAVADAKSKADEYAGAAGQHLGAVTSLKETSTVSPSPVAFGGAYAATPGGRAARIPSPPIRAGQRSVRVHIQVVWQLT